MFPFQPLDTTTDSIRLLILLPTANKSELSCELKHVTFASKPSYDALSYTWGDGAPDRSIKVNGEEVMIRSNLHDALRNFTKEKRALWVDALCINMEDPEERKYQVGMMSDIYSRARKVLAWLGPAPRSFTKQQMQDMKTAASRWNAHWADLNCRAVANSSYWTRRWIINEIISAKEVRFHLGPGFFTLDDYINLMGGTEFETFQERLDLIARHREHRYSDLQRLDIILEAFKDLSCHDSRDAVFSFLGIADDTAQAMVDADYELDHFDLYAQLIRYHQASRPLKSRHDLFSTQTLWSQITWGTELDKQVERSVRLVAFSHLVQRSLGTSVNESRRAGAGHAFAEPGGMGYTVRGVFAGEILRIGPTYNELVSSWEPNKRWRAMLEDAYRGEKELIELRKADAEYSRDMLTWSDQHVKAIRSVDDAASHCSTTTKAQEPRRFIATRGMLGFAPSEARPGDLVYSFCDCNLGFVVRPVALGQWTIVGRADLSLQTLPNIVESGRYWDTLNYGTESERAERWFPDDGLSQNLQLEGFEVQDFRLDIVTLQQLTA